VWDPAKLGKTWPGLPYWLPGAVDRTDDRLYRKIVRIGDNAEVVTAQGKVIAEPGDWIVYWIGTTHELSVHKPDEFKRLFEVNETARL